MGTALVAIVSSLPLVGGAAGLKLLDDPQACVEGRGLPWMDTMMGSHSVTVQQVHPEWSDAFSAQLISDLHSRGLVGLSSLQGAMTDSGRRQSQTTERGKVFLTCITSPSRVE